MQCVEPFVKAGEVYPCGRCLPCKFRARRIWFQRVLLEASQHDFTSVVTLTYDEAACPADGQLHPDHLQRWLKRFRKRALERYTWRRLRFFACGEYGEKSARPHYHVVLFGQPSCLEGRTGRQWCADCGCDTCSDITDTWSIGATTVDPLSQAGAAYVAGYVTRKVILARSGTKRSPFLRMSNRPGIGANAMLDVASTVLQFNLPVRGVLVGRYLRRKLSEAVDQEVPRFEPSKAMRAVQEFAWINSRSIAGVYKEIFAPLASQLQQKDLLKEKAL